LIDESLRNSHPGFAEYGSNPGHPAASGKAGIDTSELAVSSKKLGKVEQSPVSEWVPAATRKVKRSEERQNASGKGKLEDEVFAELNLVLS